MRTFVIIYTTERGEYITKAYNNLDDLDSDILMCKRKNYRYSILLWQLLACTNSLFIVKGYGNHVNQKAEQTTKTQVDSITTNVDAK